MSRVPRRVLAIGPKTSGDALLHRLEAGVTASLEVVVLEPSLVRSVRARTRRDTLLGCAGLASDESQALHCGVAFHFQENGATRRHIPAASFDLTKGEPCL